MQEIQQKVQLFSKRSANSFGDIISKDKYQGRNDLRRTNDELGLPQYHIMKINQIIKFQIILVLLNKYDSAAQFVSLFTEMDIPIFLLLLPPKSLF